MKFSSLFFVLILALSGQLISGEFVTNGDFEQPLTTGWETTEVGSNIIINRGTHYDPDPDYEAYVFKGTGSGSARLYQIIDAPTTCFDFTANIKLYAWDNGSGPWAGAALIIAYLDKDELLLGQTYICARSPDCPWTNTSVSHLIIISGSLWHNYSFNIDNELSNLSGVNPLDIAKIQISLFGETHDC